MIKKILKDKLVILCLLILFIIILLGIFAPYITKYNPVEGDIIKKFAKPSAEHWLGTDYLGRDNDVFPKPSYDTSNSWSFRCWN